MFVSPELARRIEHAEAAAMQATVAAHVGHTPGAFTLAMQPGVATYVRAQSPFNKVIGLEDVSQLGALEQAHRERGEPVRIELCTLAEPRVVEQLSERGYRLLGFENVLGCRTADLALPPIRIDAHPNLKDFRRVDTEATVQQDDTGVVLDRFTQQTIEGAIADSLRSPGSLYLAYCDEQAAGAASMRVHDGVAIFTGAATLRPFRRRGVQSALIARRLTDAHAQGAELAIVTTSPGTQSMANMMKHGFALLYARAILLR